MLLETSGLCTTTRSIPHLLVTPSPLCLYDQVVGLSVLVQIQPSSALSVYRQPTHRRLQVHHCLPVSAHATCSIHALHAVAPAEVSYLLPVQGVRLLSAESLSDLIYACRHTGRVPLPPSLLLPTRATCWVVSVHQYRMQLRSSYLVTMQAQLDVYPGLCICAVLSCLSAAKHARLGARLTPAWRLLHNPSAACSAISAFNSNATYCRPAVVLHPFHISHLTWPGRSSLGPAHHH